MTDPKHLVALMYTFLLSSKPVLEPDPVSHCQLPQFYKPLVNPFAWLMDAEDDLRAIRGPDCIKAREWRNLIFGPATGSEEFRRTFRVTRATFDHILTHIRPRLDKGPLDSKVGKPRTPSRDQLGMALAYVATGQPLRIVGGWFGYGEMTAGDSVRRCATAIIESFEDVISLPDVGSDEWTTIASKFAELGGLPNVGLDMDGSYTLIEAPGEGADVPGGPYVKKDFFCHKQFYAILLLAACDADMLFRFIDVGWPGSTSDSAAFENSELGRNVDTLLPPHVVILGDKVFTNSDRVITPFKRNRRTLANLRTNRYNKRHCKTRVVIENAFGRLKTRFRILRGSMGVDTRAVPDVVMMCCILHNICQSRNDPLEEEEVQEFIEREQLTDVENREAYLMSLEELGEDEEMLDLLLHPVFDLDVNRMNLQYTSRTGNVAAPGMRMREAFAEFLM